MKGNFSDITFPQRVVISKRPQGCEYTQKILSIAATKLDFFATIPSITSVLIIKLHIGVAVRKMLIYQLNIMHLPCSAQCADNI